MESAKAIIDFVKQIFSWWFTVQPWEQAVFVRGGKNARMIQPGIYMKIPFIDRVFIQATRLRMVDSNMQNLTTKDGKSIAAKSAITYEIFDLLKLYNTLSHPQNTMLGKMMSEISEFVADKNMDDLNQAKIREHVQKKLESFEQYGIRNISVQILCFSIVRTYRLIQDQSYLYEEQLKMDKAHGE